MIVRDATRRHEFEEPDDHKVAHAKRNQRGQRRRARRDGAAMFPAAVELVKARSHDSRNGEQKGIPSGSFPGVAHQQPSSDRAARAGHTGNEGHYLRKTKQDAVTPGQFAQWLFFGTEPIRQGQNQRKHDEHRGRDVQVAQAAFDSVFK